MAARLGLMGLGPGPVQEPPPPERARGNMRDVKGVGCGTEEDKGQ